MPKTPACSPLKRAPAAPRFTRSLLLSYADSPAQRSYGLPTEDTSDADDDDSDDNDELDIRAASPVGTPAPLRPEMDTNAADDSNTRRNSWTGGSAAERKSFRASVAFQNLQTARQVLVNAKRRSFQLGERSVSATFNQLRSCSLSSMRYGDPSSPGDRDAASDNNRDGGESPPGTATGNNNQENNQEQQDPEQPEQDQDQPTQQKKKRFRTASYQSALAKYLPTLFTRSLSAKSTRATERGGDSGLGSSNNDGDDSDRESSSIMSNESASDSEDDVSKHEPKASGRMMRLPRWPLRLLRKQPHEESEHGGGSPAAQSP